MFFRAILLMAAEGSQRRERADDNEEEQAHKERAKKAYARLQSLSTAMGTRDASRTALRLSRWGNPLHMQWKDINETVTTSMVKEVWPCPDSETNKGRWKVSRCRVDEIKNNAETIAMEVFGHPLHNHDAPLYFAKMLYMHFVLQNPVDFSSKEAPQSAATDFKAQSITLSKDELQLALEGAKLELMEQKEVLQKTLEEKEREAQRILETSTPLRAHQRIEERLTQLQEGYEALSQRIPDAGCMMSAVLHPEAVVPPSCVPSTSNVAQCPSCTKVFDNWSGFYQLACGHYYHLACLIRSMILGESCLICSTPYPITLYRMFRMQAPLPRPPNERVSTSSILRNLNFDQENTS